MEWKYVKSINEDTILEVENKYNINLPESLKKVILKYNGGTPCKQIFDTMKEKVLKCLISYNDEDGDNIYIFDDIFKKGYIPFASTVFGDVLCIGQYEKIYIYMHELDKFDYVCKDINEFLENLY